ncbi:MAG: DUF3786 domain-containing protein [Desulfopila sp.]
MTESTVAGRSGKNPIFAKTYHQYLRRIGEIDYLAKAELLGATVEGKQLVIPFYHRSYLVSPEGIRACDGKRPSERARVILANYVLYCDHGVADGADPYRSFRDFADAMPLLSYFANTVSQPLIAGFSGKREELEKAALALGGFSQENAGFDCSMLFQALPKIPVMLNFNDADEMFAASCSILYRRSAARFLDMECLAVTGTVLTSRLLAISEVYRG